jgi:long-chain acyl-CoA synthetase
MMMALSCYSQKITIATAYDNLGMDALAFSLNECEICTLFTQQDLMDTVDAVGNSVPSLKNIIYSGEIKTERLNEIKAKLPHLNFYSIKEIEELGVKNPKPANPPMGNDMCCIMYTSGSTGNPKGVMLTHGNMVAAVAGGCKLMDACFSKDQYYLGYLPLAHVLEFAFEVVCIFKGIAIGYGSPRTLTDASVRECKGDICELRPHFMAGVPAVWETIRKGVNSKLEKATPIQKRVFELAFQLKKLLLSTNLPSSFINKTIFKKISDNTGGRLEAIFSGIFISNYWWCTIGS